MSVYTDTFTNVLLCTTTAGYTGGPTGGWAHGLWLQVTVAACVSAYNILNESSGTTNHANRLLWAKQVLKTPTAIPPLFFYGVVQDATIIANGTGASTDAQVQSAMDAVVSALVTGMVF